MLDLKFIRENKDKVEAALAAKNVAVCVGEIISLDEKRRSLLAAIDDLRSQKNKVNEEIKRLLQQKKEVNSLIEQMKGRATELSDLEQELRVVKDELDRKLLHIPNIPHESVPRGDISHNKIIREWGQKRRFKFTPLTHIELAQQLDIIDFKRGTKLSGSNFVLFKGQGARLVRALLSYMLDQHTKYHGYTEVFPAFIVNSASMTTTGQLPNLESEMYRVQNEDLYLIPTAEVPVTNIHRNEILEGERLPLYYTAYTPCFRKEAGSYGKETKGLLRVHQFDKVELVKFVKPESSYQELESLLGNACDIIQKLEIPYRIVLLASGDLSFAAAKCYDIEIYSPGVDMWLEVSSCSNFEDFQARRGNIKFKDREMRKPQFVHTLNGSGVALARLIVAILENYQQADGTIRIPEILKPYFDGKERIH